MTESIKDETETQRGVNKCLQSDDQKFAIASLTGFYTYSHLVSLFRVLVSRLTWSTVSENDHEYLTHFTDKEHISAIFVFRNNKTRNNQ